MVRVLAVPYHCQQICGVLLSCPAARSALQEFGAWLKFLDRSGVGRNEVGSPQATGFLSNRRRRFLACLSWKGSAERRRQHGLCQSNQVIDYPRGGQGVVPFQVVDTDPMWQAAIGKNAPVGSCFGKMPLDELPRNSGPSTGCSPCQVLPSPVPCRTKAASSSTPGQGAGGRGGMAEQGVVRAQEHRDLLLSSPLSLVAKWKQAWGSFPAGTGHVAPWVPANLDICYI